MSWLKQVMLFIVVVVVLGVLLIGVPIALNIERDRFLETQCQELSKDTGYGTLVRHDTCYVEIAEGLWVPEDDIVYFLDFVKGD